MRLEKIIRVWYLFVMESTVAERAEITLYESKCYKQHQYLTDFLVLPLLVWPCRWSPTCRCSPDKWQHVGIPIRFMLFWQVIPPPPPFSSWVWESRQMLEVCPYISFKLARALPCLPWVSPSGIYHSGGCLCRI